MMFFFCCTLCLIIGDAERQAGAAWADLIETLQLGAWTNADSFGEINLCTDVKHDRLCLAMQGVAYLTSTDIFGGTVWNGTRTYQQSVGLRVSHWRRQDNASLFVVKWQNELKKFVTAECESAQIFRDKVILPSDPKRVQSRSLSRKSFILSVKAFSGRQRFQRHRFEVKKADEAFQICWPEQLVKDTLTSDGIIPKEATPCNADTEPGYVVRLEGSTEPKPSPAKIAVWSCAEEKNAGMPTQALAFNMDEESIDEDEDVGGYDRDAQAGFSDRAISLLIFALMSVGIAASIALCRCLQRGSSE